MGFFGVTLRIVLCPIMRGAPCSMSQRHLDRQDRAPCPLPAISCLGQRSGRATAATIAKRFSAVARSCQSRLCDITADIEGRTDMSRSRGTAESDPNPTCLIGTGDEVRSCGGYLWRQAGLAPSFYQRLGQRGRKREGVAEAR